ncbi:1977_t:CDS:2, partial [Racocetra fulgida]
LVKEIQDVLDKESSYMRMEEYKGEIPMVGLATIPKTFFESIETIVLQYLMPPMVFKVCEQMHECFFYDCVKINHSDIESILQEQVDMDYDEGMREDNYELMKVNLVNIIERIGHEHIIEVWKLVLSCGTKNQYVIIAADGLIAWRWYKDDLVKQDANKIWNQPSISLCVDTIQNQNITNHACDFGYLKEIRNSDVYTPVLQEINSTRQKYGRAHGIMRKALDLAIATSSYNELIGICQ